MDLAAQLQPCGACTECARITAECVLPARCWGLAQQGKSNARMGSHKSKACSKDGM